VRGALRRNEHQRVSSRDLYAQWQWNYQQRWYAQLGARRSKIHFDVADFFIAANNPNDSGKREYSSTSPAAGLLYRWNPQLSFYINWGRGFETPTITELAYRNDGLSGLNTELEPSRSRQTEWGARYLNNQTQWSIALFQANTSNDIVLASNSGGRSTFRNAPGTLRQGAEFSWSTRFAERWRYSMAYTYLDATFSSAFSTCTVTPCTTPNRLIAEGTRLPGIAKHTLWNELRWDLSEKTRFSAQAQWSDRFSAEDTGTVFAPSSSRIDLSAEHDWTFREQTLRGFVRVNNIFDRQYVSSVIINESNGRYFEPAPGREWSAGLSIDF
jgi:iron complex outermembrane recepter protein